MRRFSSRTSIGLIISWIIIFEGFVAYSIADVARIEGIGTILSTTFQMAALQMIALGVFISIMWALRQFIMKEGRPIVSLIFDVLTYIAMTIVTIEGLVMVYYGGPVFIEGVGGITNEMMVLVGGQLFMLGVLSLRFWWLKKAEPTNWLVDDLGTIISALLMTEGLVAIGIAGVTRIEGIGTILAQTFANAGLQLLVLGAILFALWTMVNHPRFEGRLSKILNDRTILMIVSAISGIIIIEGIIASLWAGSIQIVGGRSFPKEYVVAGCAQLFFLGLISPFLWRVRRRELGFNFTPNFVTPMVLSIIATEGVFAIGLSSAARIKNIGGITEGTFALAGEQLLGLAIIGIIAWMIKDIVPADLPKRIVSAVPLVCLSIVGLEGLAASLMASDMFIIDIAQGISEKYVLLGGGQMVLLSAIGLVCWARSEGISFNYKLAGTAAAMFIMLMLPFALVL